MEYRFVHHWNYALQEDEHQILESAISLTSQPRDESFLQRAAKFIATHAQVQYVLIGSLSEDGKEVVTKVFLKNGEVLPNISYSLQSSPCDSVLTQRFCYYPDNVQSHFPKDIELQELNIESYLGSIFLKEDGEPVGLIALMNDRPFDNAAFAEHLVLVLSPAIEEELVLQCHPTL
ncbi:GAF domain-containing protein [Pontibacter indicus]|uniref:GAF domain-containing protein n=1 Tax=Pontibacter indicus TaxID=1317125 RepID=A0A1R3X3B2_9BACT|nr:GAF domain-containing protein [Pontibacter indicus]SIT83831.1 hypothetical protein SAMN05444128_1319 [Pontibacter indicus]